jgi:hypothetical protein
VPPPVEAAATRALWSLVAGLLLIYLVVFGMAAAGRLVRPLDEFTYGESWLLDGARRVAQAESLYTPVDRLPLMHTAYTPLYYLVVGALLRVFGDSGYVLGRLVSLLATLVGGGLLAWSVRSLSGRWRVGLLATGLFLTQNVTALLWAPLHRVDPLALAFTLGGLALATAGRAYPAAGLFVLAAFTKQSFLIAPLAVCLGLQPAHSRLRWCALVLVIGAIAFGLAEWQSGGWFLWHTVAGNANEADLNTFAILMGSFLQFNGLPLLAALGTLLLPARPRERTWRLYFLLSLATLVTLAKLGASSNYWLELTAATSALLALGAARLSQTAGVRAVVPLVLSGALLVAMPAYQAAAFEATETARELLQPAAVHYLSLVGDAGSAAYRVDTRFVAQVAAEPGELLTDNSGLAVAAGKRIAFEFQIFQLLHVEGRWSEQPILEAIAARRFALVALMHPLDGPIEGTRISPAVRDALLAAYAPAGSEAGFWLYRPR